MTSIPTLRVALFTDSYAEANGVARLSRALETYSRDRALPLLCVHGGTATSVTERGSISRLELRRSRAAFQLESDLSFDPLLWRHYSRAKRTLERFAPDIIHITGPSDVGQIGALLGHRLSIPMVGSWHTNLHQYAALRVSKWLGKSGPASHAISTAIERHVLSAALLFYRIPRVLLAPNPALVDLLAQRTARPAHLMPHGVDTQAFTPAKRTRTDGPLRIGFVGRLSAEKNVRLLARLDRVLKHAGVPPCQVVVIGHGQERRQLEEGMPTAAFCGVLTGDALARAYADLDLFVFPSESETFGLAVLEAMASGLAVLAMAQGGPTAFVEHGVSGWLAYGDDEFIDAAVRLVHDAALRQALGHGARTRALALSWEAAFDRIHEVYVATLRQARVSEQSLAAPLAAESTRPDRSLGGPVM